MSTRAMIDVVNRDTGETIRLYSGHDSYPSGARMGAGIEMNPFGLEACADYVYTIEFSAEKPVNLICQHVNWSGDNKRPTRERLDPPIDLEKAIFS